MTGPSLAAALLPLPASAALLLGLLMLALRRPAGATLAIGAQGVAMALAIACAAATRETPVLLPLALLVLALAELLVLGLWLPRVLRRLVPEDEADEPGGFLPVLAGVVLVALVLLALPRAAGVPADRAGIALALVIALLGLLRSILCRAGPGQAVGVLGLVNGVTLLAAEASASAWPALLALAAPALAALLVMALGRRAPGAA